MVDFRNTKSLEWNWKGLSEIYLFIKEYVFENEGFGMKSILYKQKVYANSRKELS